MVKFLRAYVVALMRRLLFQCPYWYEFSTVGVFVVAFMWVEQAFSSNDEPETRAALLAVIISVGVVAFFEVRKWRENKVEKEKERIETRKYMRTVLALIGRQISDHLATFECEIKKWKNLNEDALVHPIAERALAQMGERIVESKGKYFSSDELYQILVILRHFRMSQEALEDHANSVAEVAKSSDTKKEKQENINKNIKVIEEFALNYKGLNDLIKNFIKNHLR